MVKVHLFVAEAKALPVDAEVKIKVHIRAAAHKGVDMLPAEGGFSVPAQLHGLEPGQLRQKLQRRVHVLGAESGEIRLFRLPVQSNAAQRVGIFTLQPLNGAQKGLHLSGSEKPRQQSELFQLGQIGHKLRRLLHILRSEGGKIQLGAVVGGHGALGELNSVADGHIGVGFGPCRDLRVVPAAAEIHPVKLRQSVQQGSFPALQHYAQLRNIIPHGGGGKLHLLRAAEQHRHCHKAQQQSHVFFLSQQQIHLPLT